MERRFSVSELEVSRNKNALIMCIGYHISRFCKHMEMTFVPSGYDAI
jgi:hypothetical protein